ncbi:MAG: response regulator, partial [Alphaproteobacteria bacterium]
ESILVVEDDPAVRELAVNLLNSLNYHVISANDGPDALGIMDAISRIDLLFTDIVLPKAMDGVELARRAVSKRPGLKVLYTSGYTENAFRGSYAGPDGLDLLNKPYQKAALARSIRDALDQPTQM